MRTQNTKLHQKQLPIFQAITFLALTLCSASQAATGDFYEADTGSGNVFKFAPNGTRNTFASALLNPEGLAFDANGNLFVSDTGLNSIFRFTRTGIRNTFATDLAGPASLVFDASGNLFDAEFFGGTILKFTPDGHQSTFAAGLNGPASLLFDSAGNLFEADFGSGQIFKFTPSGAKSTFASGLRNPHGLAFDSAGNLFVADFAGSIFKFTSNGTKTTFATGLNGPHGLAFDAAGNLFELDFSSGNIFKFTPGGTKSTFATGLSNPAGLVFEPPFEPPTGRALNISTRARVQTGDNVVIAGFIVSGSDPKRVIIRGIGPFLTRFGLLGALQDPTLELHDRTGSIITSNDNWKDTQQSEINASGLAPTDDRESAIIATLSPDTYTAVERGKNDTTGLALVEVYDLDPAANSKLANLSTRSFVDVGDNVMIGGFIVGSGNGNADIIVRAIGPSLSRFEIPHVLVDPTLELHDGNGSLFAANDNWKDTQQAVIEATNLAPTNDLESAILTPLPQGAWTAIVRGKNATTGVGLVEVFVLN